MGYVFFFSLWVWLSAQSDCQSLSWQSRIDLSVRSTFDSFPQHKKWLVFDEYLTDFDPVFTTRHVSEWLADRPALTVDNFLSILSLSKHHYSLHSRTSIPSPLDNTSGYSFHFISTGMLKPPPPPRYAHIMLRKCVSMVAALRSAPSCEGCVVRECPHGKRRA